MSFEWSRPARDGRAEFSLPGSLVTAPVALWPDYVAVSADQPSAEQVRFELDGYATLLATRDEARAGVRLWSDGTPPAGAQGAPVELTATPVVGGVDGVPVQAWVRMYRASLDLWSPALGVTPEADGIGAWLGQAGGLTWAGAAGARPDLLASDATFRDHPTVAFDGVSDTMTCPALAAALAGRTTATLLWVVTRANPTPNAALFEARTGTQYLELAHITFPGPAQVPGYSTRLVGATTFSDAVPARDTRPVAIVAERCAGTEDASHRLRTWVNGEVDLTWDQGVPDGALGAYTTATLGRRASGTGYWGGRLALLAAFEEALSSDTLQWLTVLLREKYG